MSELFEDFSGVGPDAAQKLYRMMVRIRRFEEKIIEVYGVQDMKTPVHLCIGQEAIAAGVLAHFNKEDYIFTTHRGHGHCLAKGMDARDLYAEFYGRDSGCAHGKGGSMHPVDPDFGILGTSAIVGGAIPHAAGTALASKLRGDGRISATFFGDGASDEGTFHESLNFAALKKLPVIFVCENNLYAVNSHITKRHPHDRIHERAAGYRMAAESVDGGDVCAVYAAAQRAAERARNGEGPTLLECRTYRWKGHVGPECDCEKGCRPKEELEGWIARCPVDSFRDFLLEKEILSQAEVDSIFADAKAEMDKALEEGRDTPFPDKSAVYEHVYV